MAFPKPELGAVISYEYLWKYEAENGQIHGKKDRPCVIVLSITEENGMTRVVVAPVTHSKPEDEYNIEIPIKVKQYLGLDTERSWVIASEVNEFYWPGFDLKPIRSRSSGYLYGFLPPKLFNQLLIKIKESVKSKRGLKRSNRDE